MEINRAWCVAATIAADLLSWVRLLCLDRAMADAEPKTLRYRILHTAVRLVRGQRRRKIEIAETLPWARELEAAFLAVFALTAPPDPAGSDCSTPTPNPRTPADPWNRRHPTRPSGARPRPALKRRSETEAKITTGSPRTACTPGE
jgi:Transposase DDE domain group 1